MVGVEIEPDLVEFGSANLARTDQPWARIVAAEPGVLGVPGHAPYDRILVSAAARTLPAELLEQLAPEGRMVVPVSGWMVLAVKDRDGRVETSRHGSYRFVPLRTGAV